MNLGLTNCVLTRKKQRNRKLNRFCMSGGKVCSDLSNHLDVIWYRLIAFVLSHKYACFVCFCIEQHYIIRVMHARTRDRGVAECLHFPRESGVQSVSSRLAWSISRVKSKKTTKQSLSTRCSFE